LNGVVQKTFLRGRKIFDTGHFIDEPPGHMLLRATRGTKAQKAHKETWAIT
jgi:hypothetical protein